MNGRKESCPEELLSRFQRDNSEGGVLAICVNWNGKGVVGTTLASLLESDYDHLQVVVVDNASIDGSTEEIPEEAVIYRLDQNLGYGGAINRAVQPLLEVGRQDTIAPNFFLLLNNDLVVEKGAVRRLVEQARKAGPGVYGPKVLSFSDPSRLDAAWGRVTWSHVLTRFCGKSASALEERWNKTRRVELLMGCCLLVHRKVFETVGLFDERFFMYHEEVDFLYRAARAGFPIWYCPQAEVSHRGAFSTRSQPLQKVRWLRENTIRFFRKYRPGPLHWAYFWATLTASLLFNLVTLRWSRMNAIYRGVRRGFEG
ncbi:MAG TPA: glycosyltransferase family 2 protein [Acidobacteriota bacterium]|nr:glycosyltransferase family 2 protein [Acidobacteriota bacterium]